ncbi:MAG: hypothetical protein GY835_25365 [bacterium]|nr:hypothetical protein [bacterium]
MHKSIKSCIPAHLILIALTLILLIAGPGWADGGDVPHVKNGSTPSNGRDVLHLEELWRIGGDDEDSVLLGLISEVGGDKNGNVYVMDAQLCQVHVFAPDGELLRTLFRQGEGPGEVLRPRDMLITADKVGLAEEFPGKIIMVDHDGLPAENIRIGGTDNDNGMFALITAGAGGGNIVVAGSQIRQGETQGQQDRKSFLIGVTPDGEERVRYWEQDANRDYTNLVFKERIAAPSAWWGYTVGPDGRVYAALDHDNYAINVFEANGAPVRVIEREFEVVKRSAAERKWMRDLFESAMVGINIPYELIIEENDAPIDYWRRGMHIADDGTLWVLSSRGLREEQEGVLLSYDIFDRGGKFIRQTAIVCEGDSFYDCLFWINDDLVVLVKGGLAAMVAQFGGGTALDSDEEEPTPQEVICYRVIR